MTAQQRTIIRGLNGNIHYALQGWLVAVLDVDGAAAGLHLNSGQCSEHGRLVVVDRNSEVKALASPKLS